MAWRAAKIKRTTMGGQAHRDAGWDPVVRAEEGVEKPVAEAGEVGRRGAGLCWAEAGRGM